MNEVFGIAVWGAMSVVIFAYVGYPLVIWVLARSLGKAQVPQEFRVAERPAVSLLIAAHNEETCIAERAQNALASEYPQDKLEILIASDGSEDRTNEIVRGFAPSNVRLIAYEARRGKAATLNSSIRE